MENEDGISMKGGSGTVAGMNPMFVVVKRITVFSRA
jgi:hypothetical protein